MTRYTVECACAAYEYTRVTVEAATLDAALEMAVDAAHDRDDWASYNEIGPIFVTVATEGARRDSNPPLPIPDRFTEAGEPPLVTVIMEGGAIHDVTFEGRPCRALIRDYDVESGDPEDAEPEPEGRPALTFRYGPWPADPPDPVPELPPAPPGGG